MATFTATAKDIENANYVFRPMMVRTRTRPFRFHQPFVPPSSLPAFPPSFAHVLVCFAALLVLLVFLFSCFVSKGEA
jgi:hypothetical protein